MLYELCVMGWLKPLSLQDFIHFAKLATSSVTAHGWALPATPSDENAGP
jgi:hypothetical protein